MALLHASLSLTGSSVASARDRSLTTA